ncbi:MAG: DoxX family membrane protein [Flavobacterium sp.]|nr:DoxX family membrane protein [Flavobacterium sp.]
MSYLWHLNLMAFLFFIFGIYHFVNPKLYLKVIPSYLPQPKLLNYLAGFFEILFAILLLHSKTRFYAAIGIILMLLAFLMTHFYMLTNKKASMGLPRWFLIIRILLQFGLIYWAYQYVN